MAVPGAPFLTKKPNTRWFYKVFAVVIGPILSHQLRVQKHVEAHNRAKGVPKKMPKVLCQTVFCAFGGPEKCTLRAPEAPDVANTMLLDLQKLQML